MRVAVPLAFALLDLAACAPSVTSTRIRGPDGKDNWVAISCSGTEGACYQRAGEVCPTGYEIADQQGHEGQYSRAYVSGTVGAAMSRHTFSGELIIRCKGAPVDVGRDCMDDNSCPTGARCMFVQGAGMGHCATTADTK